MRYGSIHSKKGGETASCAMEVSTPKRRENCIMLRYALLCIVTRLISDVHFNITGPKLTFNS